jgi:hypothetical protein
MQIRPLAAELVYANRRTNVTELMGAFRDYKQTHLKVIS